MANKLGNSFEKEVTPIIVSATIVKGSFENTVRATLNDNSEVELFSYYPDELYFAESEFIGLTEDQALKLFYDRDIAYLRS